MTLNRLIIIAVLHRIYVYIQQVLSVTKTKADQSRRSRVKKKQINVIQRNKLSDYFNLAGLDESVLSAVPVFSAHDHPCDHMKHETLKKNSFPCIKPACRTL